MSTLLLALALAASAAPQTESSKAHDAPAIQRFVIDETRSVVGFDGTSTLHDFEGRCTVIGGELRVDPKSIVDSVGGEFWIPVKDLSTGSGGRDKEMYHALDVKHFSRISFKLESVAQDAAGQLSANGRFTIHGVSRARHFDFSLEPLKSGGWRAQGGIFFNITDHGVTPPSKVVVGMHDKVRVWFDLAYVPAKLERAGARVQAMQLNTLIEPLGGEALTKRSEATLWSMGSQVLLERRHDWILADERSAALLDPRLATGTSMGEVAETSFAESQALVASLRSKLSKLSGKKLEKIGPKLEASIARTMESLAFAPAPGPAQLVRGEGGVLTIELGGQVWASFESLSGDAPFPTALAALEGVPSEVRKALLQLRGLPSRFLMRTAQPTRRTTIRGSLDDPRDVSTPTWVFDPQFFAPKKAAHVDGQ
ncbi:MAG: polyisoprenoid-binding protein YceI [Planctomycetota bacterium]|jgi:polyisoprenoid-binding protein YceI